MNGLIKIGRALNASGIASPWNPVRNPNGTFKEARRWASGMLEFLPQPQVEKGRVEQPRVQREMAVCHGAHTDHLAYPERPQDRLSINGNQRLVLHNQHTKAGRQQTAFTLQGSFPPSAASPNLPRIPTVAPTARSDCHASLIGQLSNIVF